MDKTVNLINAIPLHYRLLAMIALAAAVYGLGWIKGANHEQVKAARFEAATVALGEAAKHRTDEITKADNLRKETADAENKRTIDSLRADIKRLRDKRSRESFLPAAPAGAGRPDLACFSRSDVERAIQRFDDDVTAIVAEGDEATVNLNTIKKWVQKQ